MDLNALNAEQRNALLDLLVLAMYSDGHLARTEDARIERLLGAMGFASKYEREREVDAAITRVRQYSDTVSSSRQHAQTLAHAFPTRGSRDSVISALSELLASDNDVSPAETRLLATIKEALEG